MTDLITRDPNDSGDIARPIDAETERLIVGDRTLNLAPYDIIPPPLRRSNAEAETAIVRLPQSIGIVAPCAQPDADIDVPLDGFDPGGYPPVPRPTPPPPPSMLLGAAETVTQLTAPDGPPPAPLPAPGPPPAPSLGNWPQLSPEDRESALDAATQRIVDRVAAPAWSQPAGVHRAVPGRPAYVRPDVWEWTAPQHRAPDPAWLKWLIAVGVLLVVVAVLGIVITAVMS